jgi:transcriptional regulator with XRE-family HTH domain
MDNEIPSIVEIRALLEPMRESALRRLAELSGVSLGALIKIRNGQRVNPGIETVRAFLPHVEAATSGASNSAPAPLS